MAEPRGRPQEWRKIKRELFYYFRPVLFGRTSLNQSYHRKMLEEIMTAIVPFLDQPNHNQSE